ncbi:phosphoribosyltransferase [Bacteroides sp. CAG:702]|nr:phosphoribosyltransferase [Bacteroides sp. CAG:702]
MEQCFWGRFPIERASSLFYYAKGGTVARILYAMKYDGQRKLCVKMGEWIGSELLPTGFFDGIDCLLPVPLFRTRERKRGYNQSELLARGIAEKTGLPVCRNAIYRLRNNATQTHKSGYARWLNVEELFCATADAASLAGKHILLVDDVLTTGATLTACADALSSVGGIRISVATLAWAK